MPISIGLLSVLLMKYKVLKYLDKCDHIWLSLHHACVLNLHSITVIPTLFNVIHAHIPGTVHAPIYILYAFIYILIHALLPK